MLRSKILLVHFTLRSSTRPLALPISAMVSKTIRSNGLSMNKDQNPVLSKRWTTFYTVSLMELGTRNLKFISSRCLRDRRLQHKMRGAAPPCLSVGVNPRRRRQNHPAIRSQPSKVRAIVITACKMLMQNSPKASSQRLF